MDVAEIARRLDDQDWVCAYVTDRHPNGQPLIRTGQRLAVGFDGHCLVHLECAQVGIAIADPIARIRNLARAWRYRLADHGIRTAEAASVLPDDQRNIILVVPAADWGEIEERAWEHVLDRLP